MRTPFFLVLVVVAFVGIAIELILGYHLEKGASITFEPAPALPNESLEANYDLAANRLKSIESSSNTMAMRPWAIQVASVKNKEKAKLKRDSLQKNAIRAFIIGANVQNEIYYRIYAGPYVTKAEAEKEQGKIDRQLKVHSTILPYSVEQF